MTAWIVSYLKRRIKRVFEHANLVGAFVAEG